MIGRVVIRKSARSLAKPRSAMAATSTEELFVAAYFEAIERSRFLYLEPRLCCLSPDDQ